MIYAAAIIAVWIVFNWLAPFALLPRSEPMSIGRISPEVAARAKVLGVRLYTARLEKPGGFSVIAWPLTLVVFDKDSLSATPPWAWRFLVAHELGHCALGHLRTRWLFTVTGLVLLPAARRRLLAMEREADAYAEQLTGVNADTFYNPPQGVNA